MLIGSKLPPHRVQTTYFNSGRAAFAYLIADVVKPRRVYLPTFICWSLVSTLERRFPGVDLQFYSVDRELNCRYPESIADDEALVFIHYFGYENETPLPPSEGTLLEDLSHAYLSAVTPRGDYRFGSYRKITKVVDGGFLCGAFNPLYEPSRKLDSWLRLEATDWRDVREAENMMDREWALGDISSQALAVLLTMNRDGVIARRQQNEKYLYEHFPAGRPFRAFRAHECPMVHNRLFSTTEERDTLRRKLAEQNIFTSIHWPTHKRVQAARDQVDIEDVRWLEGHILSIPVAEDYDLNDMERIVEAA